jgi:hypothetical protein
MVCQGKKRVAGYGHRPCLTPETVLGPVPLNLTVTVTVYRKFEKNIPRNETVRPNPTFISVSHLYIPTIGLPILL